jgi:hypothetical protein
VTAEKKAFPVSVPLWTEREDQVRLVTGGRRQALAPEPRTFEILVQEIEERQVAL